MICNLGVVGSNPTRGSKGRIPEWPNGADCKSAVFRLRWFESIFTHKTDVAKTGFPGSAVFFEIPPYLLYMAIRQVKKNIFATMKVAGIAQLIEH